MTTTVHKNLTGADLHEPKGADTATSGKVYVSNGAGSGVWTDASTIITNTAFTTGDAKLTYKTTADTGWVLANDGTIGDGSSGGTTRANADTSALFTLLWGLPVLLTVSSGRGASAAADFAAHKTIQVPLSLGRALGIAGAGSGLTSRAVGASVGAETYTQIRSDLPNVSPTFTGNSQTVNSNQSNVDVGGSGVGGLGSSGQIGLTGVNLQPISVTFTPTGTVQSLNGGVTQTAMPIVQPTGFLNLMIKL